MPPANQIIEIYNLRKWHSMKQLILMMCLTLLTFHAHAEEIAPPTLISQEFEQQQHYSNFQSSFEGTAKYTLHTFYNDPKDGLNLQFQGQAALAHIVHDNQGGLSVGYDSGFPENLKNIEARMTENNKIEISVRGVNVLTQGKLLARFQVFTRDSQSGWVTSSSPLIPMIVYNQSVEVPALLGAPQKVDTIANWVHSLKAQMQNKTKDSLWIRIQVRFMSEAQPSYDVPVVLVPHIELASLDGNAMQAAIENWIEANGVNLGNGKLIFSLNVGRNIEELGQIIPNYANENLELSGKNISF